MSGYTPRDGSVAQRVLWFLEEHGASSCTAIAEGVEDVESKQLHACLSSAIAHGAMFTEKRDGVTWYNAKPFAAQETDTPRGSLNGKSLRPEAATGDRVEASSGRHAVAPDPHHGSPGVGPMGSRQPADAGPPTVVKLTKQLPTRARRTFGCGIFSDGRLVLELASGADVVLQRDETRALVTFLDRALHEELTA